MAKRQCRSLLALPSPFSGEEEEAERDSVSMCQQQSCCPESQRRPRVPNPQQQSLASTCSVPAAADVSIRAFYPHVVYLASLEQG